MNHAISGRNPRDTDPTIDRIAETPAETSASAAVQAARRQALNDYREEETPAELSAATAVQAARLQALNALPRGCLYGVSDHWLRSLRTIALTALFLQTVQTGLLVWVVLRLIQH